MPATRLHYACLMCSPDPDTLHDITARGRSAGLSATGKPRQRCTGPFERESAAFTQQRGYRLPLIPARRYHGVGNHRFPSQAPSGSSAIVITVIPIAFRRLSPGHTDRFSIYACHSGCQSSKQSDIQAASTTVPARGYDGGPVFRRPIRLPCADVIILYCHGGVSAEISAKNRHHLIL